MSSFILHHRHQPEECPSAYAAWKGFESPLRGQQAPSSCRLGGHEIWWEVGRRTPSVTSLDSSRTEQSSPE